jgi:uncharacterized protein YcaQ
VDLERPRWSPDLAGLAGLLDRLGQIQIDPIDRIGTNPDLVVQARIDGLQRGDWCRPLPGGAFEHVAKERCLLPGRLFPAWREAAAQAGWWRLDERLEKLGGEAIIEEVYAEIAARGPLSTAELEDRGAVVPMDWQGWKGTARAASLAVEVLWTRCRVVAVGRSPQGHRRYDIPARVLPDHCDAPAQPYGEVALLERVRGAGLMARNTGPWWCGLTGQRRDGTVEGLIARGLLLEVEIEGARRRLLCCPEALEAARAPWEGDGRLRLLGPLDPLLWDRELLRILFDFDYVWEIYKPEAQRRWGYYVCPLLQDERLVGRVEGRRDPGGGLALLGRWAEAGPAPFGPAFDECWGRLAAFQPVRA